MCTLEKARHLDKNYLETITRDPNKKEVVTILENAIAELDIDAILSAKYPKL